MSNVVEAEPFPEEVNKLLQGVLHQCEGKDAETVVNVLANALIVVAKSVDVDLEKVRTFMNNMIDTHLAADRQEEQKS